MSTQSLLRPRRRSFVELEPRAAPDGAFDEPIDWDVLEPRGAWHAVGRPIFDEVLLAIVFLPAALLGLALATINACIFGSWRRAFFLQPRVGDRGRIFQIVKFRTLRDGDDEAFVPWTAGGDASRATGFGRWLRSTHLDELPQIVNVLRGEMSFMGPRPELVELEEWAGAQVPGFIERLAIKPGITGLAQVTQGYTPRDVGEYQIRFALCRRYLRSYSLAIDLAILLRTALWMVRGRGWNWKRGEAKAALHAAARNGRADRCDTA